MMSQASLSSFLSLAEEYRVLTHFVGGLATSLVTDTSNLGTLKLYVIREDSVETFDPKGTSKYVRVVGLAYALLNQTRLENLRFWFRPTLSKEKLRQSLAYFLQHVTQDLEPSVKLSAVESAHYLIVQESVEKVEWKNDEGYRLYILDASVPVKDVPVGSTWQVDGETFEMDVAHNDDAPVLISQTKIGYNQEYMLSLINHPVMSKLIRVVRLASTKQAVSWSLVHSDFSVGLLSTLPEYRRKGLVQKALASTLASYRDVVASQMVCSVSSHTALSTLKTSQAKILWPLLALSTFPTRHSTG
ncbi:hypothetical protein AC1031_012990 [Aphanomyces cochlioides]|nr:hypothetical protein AC1031_012990 [Aphanomyces cochlioides]